MYHDRTERLPGAELDEETDISGARRLLALAFVSLIVGAVPMYWATSAVGS